MSDNLSTANGVVATRQVTYSGDSVHAQVMGLAAFSGADDAKAVADLPGDAANGLDVDVTRVIPGTTATALGKAEDAAHVNGDTGVMTLAVRQDTLAALAGTTGDYIPLSTNARGAAWMVNEPDANAGTQLGSDVTVTFTLNQAAGTDSTSADISAPTVRPRNHRFEVVVYNAASAAGNVWLQNKETALASGTRYPDLAGYQFQVPASGGLVAFTVEGWLVSGTGRIRCQPATTNGSAADLTFRIRQG